MRQGMLWWCGDKYVLAEQIAKACKRYSEKYGRTVSIVYINPATLVAALARGEKGAENGVEVKAARSVLVGHLWVGEKSQ